MRIPTPTDLAMIGLTVAEFNQRMDELAYEQFREVPGVAESIAFQALADRLRKKEPKMDLCGPPLKTLVAEYLFDLYKKHYPGGSIPGLNFDARFEVLTDFLAWEEKRRTPPAITTRPGDSLIQQGVIPIDSAPGQVQWLPDPAKP